MRTKSKSRLRAGFSDAFGVLKVDLFTEIKEEVDENELKAGLDSGEIVWIEEDRPYRKSRSIRVQTSIVIGILGVIVSVVVAI